MHRIDGATAAASLPDAGAVVGTPGYFSDGDPGTSTPATIVSQDWANAVQEEIVAVVLAAGLTLDKANNGQLLAALRAIGAPAGKIDAFAMATAPAGYLECDGSAISRTTYAALFAAIGTTYGAGDGSTTFGLPDLRGEFLRGWDHGRGVDTGRTLGSAQAGAIESHSHTVPYGGAEGDVLTTTTNGASSDGTLPTGATGGSETRPRNVAVMLCIKT